MRMHRAKPPNVCNAWAHTRTYIHAPYIYRSKCQNHYPMAHLHHDERIYDTLFCVLSHIICIYKTATRTEIIRKIYLRPFVTHTQTAHKQRHTLTHTHTHECVRTRRKKWPDRWGKLNTKKRTHKRLKCRVSYTHAHMSYLRRGVSAHRSNITCTTRTNREWRCALIRPWDTRTCGISAQCVYLITCPYTCIIMYGMSLSHIDMSIELPSCGHA